VEDARAGLHQVGGRPDAAHHHYRVGGRGIGLRTRPVSESDRCRCL